MELLLSLLRGLEILAGLTLRLKSLEEAGLVIHTDTLLAAVEAAVEQLTPLPQAFNLIPLL
jgi:hypothetical protein